MSNFGNALCIRSLLHSFPFCRVNVYQESLTVHSTAVTVSEAGWEACGFKKHVGPGWVRTCPLLLLPHSPLRSPHQSVHHRHDFWHISHIIERPLASFPLTVDVITKKKQDYYNCRAGVILFKNTHKCQWCTQVFGSRRHVIMIMVPQATTVKVWWSNRKLSSRCCCYARNILLRSVRSRTPPL